MFEQNDPNRIQLNSSGQLRHFLTTEGLPRELLTEILDTADSFVDMGAKQIKKMPLLRGRTVVNLFFEASTRTLSTGTRRSDRARGWTATMPPPTSCAP